MEQEKKNRQQALSKIKIDFFIHSSFVERVTDLEFIMFYHIVFFFSHSLSLFLSASIFPSMLVVRSDAFFTIFTAAGTFYCCCF